MSRYLITGGAGFIGSNAAHRYLSRGERVTLLDNFSRWGARDNVAWLQSQFGDLVDVVDGDVTDLTTVMRVVSNATVVLLCARGRRGCPRGTASHNGDSGNRSR